MGRVLVCVAAGLGAVHAAFSLYWSAGGRWLLDTVGAWAVRAVDERPTTAAVGLAAVGLAKLVAAITPVLLEYGIIRPRRLVRAASWVGSLGLIVYGGVIAATGCLVLSGAIEPQGGYDRAAMIGHAFIWDPLFLLWGAALAGWLMRTRRPSPARDDAGADWGSGTVVGIG